MITVYKIVESTKNIEEYKDLKVNSFLGTLLFWKNIEEKYLDKTQISRLFDLQLKNSKTQDIWDLVDDPRLKLMERILMAASFDFCMIRKEHFPILFEAFTSEYATESMPAIAECLEKLEQEPDCLGACISWNSVFDPYGPTYDDNDEEILPTIDTEF